MIEKHHITVEKGSEMDKEISEVKCTVHIPMVTEDREYRRFVVIGFTTNGEKTKAELITFCEAPDLLKADMAIKDAIQVAVRDKSIDVDDIFEAIITHMRGL
jgi:hypothetical protein